MSLKTGLHPKIYYVVQVKLRLDVRARGDSTKTTRTRLRVFSAEVYSRYLYQYLEYFCGSMEYSWMGRVGSAGGTPIRIIADRGHTVV